MLLAIDVVVVSYNSRDTLRACVEPLAGLDDVSVIVVDNASADQSLETIADLPVRTVASEHNRGFARRVQPRSRRRRRAVRVVPQPDAYISEEAVRRLADVLVSEPECRDSGSTHDRSRRSTGASMRRYQRVRSVWARHYSCTESSSGRRGPTKS